MSFVQKKRSQELKQSSPTKKRRLSADNNSKQKPLSHFFAKKEAHSQKEVVESVSSTIQSATKSPTLSVSQPLVDVAVEFSSTVSSIDTEEPQQLFDIFTYRPHQRPLYWKERTEIPYQLISDAFAVIDATKSRLHIVSALTNLYRTVLHFHPQDFLPVVWLSSNAIAPDYEGVEIGIGGTTLVKSLSTVANTNSKSLKAAYDRLGDMGDVAYEIKSRMKTLCMPKRLVAAHVFQTLHKISTLKGSKIQQQKTDLLSKLLVAAQGEEVRYLVRTVISNLRIGAVRTSVLNAAARAAILHNEFPFLHEMPLAIREKEVVQARLAEAEIIVKKCYARVPNYNVIIPFLNDPQVGIDRLLDTCIVRPGIPIRPMLGKITRGLDEVQDKLKNAQFLCDVKYDGQRAQIHLATDGNISIFSRHLEKMTDKYPDIVKLLQECKKESTTSFIIDAEVVAVDGRTGALQSFQTLSNRSRKNVQIDQIQVQVCVMVFDIMFLNDKPLLECTLRERRKLLNDAFVIKSNQFQVTECIEANSSTIDDVSISLHDAINRGCEGLMIKLLDEPIYEPLAIAKSTDVDLNGKQLREKKRGAILSTYEPDKRSDAWLKVKKDYLTGIADSVDCVPIAAWYGNGRKAGWFSPFLLAVYNPDTCCFDTLTKVMSGFSDAFYKARLETYTRDNGRLIDAPKPYYNVSEIFRPDVWFEPTEVWEIRGADFTLSTTHTCGIDHERLRDEGRGISLRFPRFIRVRDDKRPDEGGGVTTVSEVVDLWEKQALRHLPSSTGREANQRPIPSANDKEMDEIDGQEIEMEATESSDVDSNK